LTWSIAIAVVAFVVLAAAGFLLRARRFVRATPAIPGVVIDTPVDDTEVGVGGACRSVQSAEITLPPNVLGDLWTPVMLERLGRTYWAFMSTWSCHILRVFYGEQGRSVAILFRPFSVLGFGVPEYETSEFQGKISWPITHGFLVAQRGRKERTGHLEIEVRKLEDMPDGGVRVHIEVEIASFYPLFNRISPWLYANTQSRIHVLLAYGFLRRIVARDLEQSVAGRFSREDTL
jgi:hypothetical protein